MENELIAEFCKVTGAEASRARIYLESSGWDNNLAMSNFFEAAEEEPEIVPPIPFQQPASPKPAFPPPPSSNSRIGTIAGLAQDTNDDEEEGQAFYAGGSERSGQQVIGPGKRKAGNEIVEEMFKSVRKFGGEVQDSSSKRCSTSKLKPFRGAGHVLGSTSEAQSEAVADDPSDVPMQDVEIRLQLWQTGFTVDDGTMRDYTEPGSKDFLDSIRKGEIPADLRHKAEGKKVHLSVEDRSHEDYAPQKTPLQAFAGAGFRLGNVTPVVHTEGGASAEKNTSEAQQGLQLDESKPVTSIQIRLADGSRLVMRANHTHTVGDVRTFIVQARPEYSASVFTLMTAFPPKELNSDSATLEEENLLNAVIVQKLK